MSQMNYILWAIVIVFFTTVMNLSTDNSSTSFSRSWSSSSGSSGSGWSSGGSHK